MLNSDGIAHGLRNGVVFTLFLMFATGVAVRLNLVPTVNRESSDVVLHAFLRGTAAKSTSLRTGRDGLKTGTRRASRTSTFAWTRGKLVGFRINRFLFGSWRTPSTSSWLLRE